MTIETQENEINIFFQNMKETLFKKSSDYANEDVLSNFKLAASIIGVTPEINCLSLIATKVARLGVLLNSNSDIQNESISDTILDLANYSVLLHCIREDVNKTNNPSCIITGFSDQKKNL